MDTPTAVRLSRQAHALDLLQTQLRALQVENANLRAVLAAREAEMGALQTLLASMRIELAVLEVEGEGEDPDTHD